MDLKVEADKVVLSRSQISCPFQEITLACFCSGFDHAFILSFQLLVLLTELLVVDVECFLDGFLLLEALMFAELE